MVLAETQAVPMKVDQDGVIRIGGTRVRLDTVILAFNVREDPTGAGLAERMGASHRPVCASALTTQRRTR